MKTSIFVCMTLVLALATVQCMNLREGEGDLRKGQHRHRHGEGEGPSDGGDVEHVQDQRMMTRGRGGRHHGPPPVKDAEFYKIRFNELCLGFLGFYDEQVVESRLVRALATLLKRQAEPDPEIVELVAFCNSYTAAETD